MSEETRTITLELEKSFHDYITKIADLYVEMGLVDEVGDFYQDLFRGGMIAYTKYMLTHEPKIVEWDTWGAVMDSIVHGYDEIITLTRNFLSGVLDSEDSSATMFG